MVGYILRLEADARRNLPGLEYIVAIQIQDSLSLGKAIAQGGIYIAGNRQVVNSLNRFAVHKSGDGQLHLLNASSRLPIMLLISLTGDKEDP